LLHCCSSSVQLDLRDTGPSYGKVENFKQGETNSHLAIMARLTRAAAKKEAAQERQSESPNASKKLPVRAKDDGASEGEGDVAPAKQSTQPAKGNLTVFGDDDDDNLANAASAKAAPEVSMKPPTPQPAEAEEESDDDEAPEAVSTTQAASAIKKSTQAAQQAAQE
jgi:hypothetical protein